MMDISNDHAIGIDIGGTNTKYGIVNHRGQIIFEGSIKTDQYPTIDEFIDALYGKLQPEIDAMKDVNIVGIGLGAPNGNFYTGTIDYAPNLRWKGIVPLAQLVTEKFGITAKLTNDANAAAVGEMMYGAARGMKDFIMITLGTGVGSGIFANGELVLGHDGFAGELGHSIVIPGGRLHPHTGLYGSLESYASATGVTVTAKEFLSGTAEASILRETPTDDLNSKIVFDAAIAGDAIAMKVFEFTGNILGMALANFVTFSSPQAIILFGGLTKAGDILMKPVKDSMERNLLPIFRNKIQLIFSELKESDAAILGASALVW
ncbi:ROK family protein [Ferruginibacter yonginensis]|uniref:ROK family protein n=2 Tax=Ferruginibacter yonginensis TaxID=1310416 RepID=A0ABV8QQB8_9BACT